MMQTRTNPMIFTQEDIERIISSSDPEAGNELMTYVNRVQSGILAPIETVNTHFRGMVSAFRHTEFSAMCKKQRNPDFGELQIELTHNKRICEMKSLKDYLLGYRDLDIYQEEIVICVLVDLVRALNPLRCQVIGSFKPRGGTYSEFVAEFRADY